MKDGLNNNLVPIVVEQEGRVERAYDIYSRLLKERIVFLGTEVSETSANLVVAQLLWLAQEDSQADIYFYINSPGGSIMAGNSIIDTMDYIKPDIQTICLGMAASMGAILLTNGTKGKRFILPNSHVMIHELLSGFSTNDQATDIEINLKFLKILQDKLYRILADTTGKSLKQIRKDCARDYWMDANAAVAYGLADGILKKR